VKFDKETGVVIAIALALLIGWSVFYPKYQEKTQAEQIRLEQERLANELAKQQNIAAAQAQAQAQAQAAVPAPAKTAEASAAKPADASAQKPAEAPVAKPAEIPVPAVAKATFPVLENDVVKYVFDDVTGEVVSMELKKYKREIDSDALFSLKPEGKAVRTLSTNLFSAPASKVELARQKGDKDNTLVITRCLPDFKVVERFTLSSGSYVLSVDYMVVNTSGADKLLPEVIFWSAGLAPQKFLSKDKVNTPRQNIDYCYADKQKVESFEPNPKEPEKLEKNSTHSRVAWAGSSNKYFASLMFPEEVFDNGVRLDQAVDEQNGEKYAIPSVGGAMKNVSLPNNTAKSFRLNYYFGPKELRQIDKLPATAMDAMHIAYWSWFEFIALPLARFLVWLNGFIGNYGVAIIILTLIVRLVLWPFQQKANTSMRKMQKLQPMMKEMREKYKDNPQELNARMMELYRTEGVNPLGGCLPMLLQLPIFFALYSVFDSSVELRHVSFLWAKDLAQPDQVGPAIQILGFQLAIHPWIILMTILMVIQQKMTPSQGEPMQQKMMMAMPIIMLVMLYWLPSGLTLYWTISNAFSIIQLKYGQHLAAKEEQASSGKPQKTAKAK